MASSADLGPMRVSSAATRCRQDVLAVVDAWHSQSFSESCRQGPLQPRDRSGRAAAPTNTNLLTMVSTMPSARARCKRAPLWHHLQSMGRRTALAPRAAESTLAALLFIAPLLLGGAPAWALWPTCALAGACGVLAAASARSQRHSLRVPLAAALPLGVAALCLLQLLPLPPWLLGL